MILECSAVDDGAEARATSDEAEHLHLEVSHIELAVLARLKAADMVVRRVLAARHDVIAVVAASCVGKVIRDVDIVDFLIKPAAVGCEYDSLVSVPALNLSVKLHGIAAEQLCSCFHDCVPFFYHIKD